MKIEVLKIKKKNTFYFFKKYKFQILLTIFILLISAFFILNSYKYIQVTIEGILVYGTKVLPTLLPFVFVTKVLSNFDFIYSVCNKFSGVSKFLFNTKSISCYIFFMSIISGYPIGAKLTSEFYEKNLIDSTDAQKILSFCSTSGPLFIIGSVGVGFFHNALLGITIFVIHVVSSIINGLLYRNYNKKQINVLIKENENNKTIKEFSLQECMYSSIVSVLIVGGFIIIFYVLIQILLDYNLLYPFIRLFELLGLENTLSTGLIAGLIEITKGVSILSMSQNVQLSFIIASFLISFSGLSVLMQATTFLDKTKINKKLYYFQKFTHALISLILSILISFLIF